MAKKATFRRPGATRDETFRPRSLGGGQFLIREGGRDRLVSRKDLQDIAARNDARFGTTNPSSRFGEARTDERAQNVALKRMAQALPAASGMHVARPNTFLDQYTARIAPPGRTDLERSGSMLTAPPTFEPDEAVEPWDARQQQIYRRQVAAHIQAQRPGAAGLIEQGVRHGVQFDPYTMALYQGGQLPRGELEIRKELAAWVGQAKMAAEVSLANVRDARQRGKDLGVLAGYGKFDYLGLEDDDPLLLQLRALQRAGLSKPGFHGEALKQIAGLLEMHQERLAGSMKREADTAAREEETIRKEDRAAGRERGEARRTESIKIRTDRIARLDKRIERAEKSLSADSSPADRKKAQADIEGWEADVKKLEAEIDRLAEQGGAEGEETGQGPGPEFSRLPPLESYAAPEGGDWMGSVEGQGAQPPGMRGHSRYSEGVSEIVRHVGANSPPERWLPKARALDAADRMSLARWMLQFRHMDALDAMIEGDKKNRLLSAEEFDALAVWGRRNGYF